MVVLLKDKPVVKIVKLRRIDKLFTDLIFAYFRMLEALFNFPRWMNLFGVLSVSESGGILIYLDLIQPGGRWRRHYAFALQILTGSLKKIEKKRKKWKNVDTIIKFLCFFCFVFLLYVKIEIEMSIIMLLRRLQL